MFIMARMFEVRQRLRRAFLRETTPDMRALLGIRRRIYEMALFSVLSILFAASISWGTGDWTWVARAGSIPIVFGVLLLLQDLALIEMLKSGVPQSTISRSVAPGVKELKDEEVRTLIDATRVLRRRAEVGFLISGTLISSWGDLPGLLTTPQ
ncbi:hypothetical protein DKT77_06935 [Meridianimarinicoccus roseus]|uniref:Uncharacterized protein n=1 Tax=Meridianimarinicoccus roseus TaxID=2072018 RepID=A0A2V2LNV6_9RHOB|nr:hypothetical protein DKT77_06935 [Meridianimarinicoccus roseus]